ncbi:MAG TPA: AbrB/MazE/SpoVT family DNA-binding domain-containing protein [Gammaproteobacteria bacterium]|nr:AbrB/MazE/SpoVT family DNA-binding domain-containing protein [Gammaproteobacteria bacterium]
MINPIPLHLVKLIAIGNSKGIRIPKGLLQKYGIEDTLVLEECEQGILLHAKEDKKLSWSATFKQIAQSDENWDDFDVTLNDGLEDDDGDQSEKI